MRWLKAHWRWICLGACITYAERVVGAATYRHHQWVLAGMMIFDAALLFLPTAVEVTFLGRSLARTKHIYQVRHIIADDVWGLAAHIGPVDAGNQLLLEVRAGGKALEIYSVTDDLGQTWAPFSAAGGRRIWRTLLTTYETELIVTAHFNEAAANVHGLLAELGPNAKIVGSLDTLWKLTD